MPPKIKKPYVKHPRFSGKKLRLLAILNIRAAKLQHTLRSGRKNVKGIEMKITELDMEKLGYHLEKCEAEITRITRGQEA